MAKIHLFESRRLSDAERLSGLRIEPVTPRARSGRWRYLLPHAEALPVLVWIARGQGRITIEARTRGYGPATLTVLPPRTPFALLPGTVTEGMLVRLPDLFEAPLPERPTRLRLSDVATQGELGGLLDRLARAGDLREPAAGRAALARIILLSALIEREGHRAAPAHAEDEEGRLAARFAHGVESSLGGGADVEAIAARLGETPEALDRTLTETCGRTAAAYRAERAMHEARRRLADTDDGAQAIAHELGFASPAQFAGAFTESAGQTPSAFREAERRSAPASRSA